MRIETRENAAESGGRFNDGTVPTGEIYNRERPLMSRLAYRYMLGELVGTFLLTVVSCGVMIAAVVIEKKQEDRDAQTMSRALLQALGQGFGFAAVCYYIYSFMRVQYRFKDEYFRALNSEQSSESKVILRANNLRGWIEGVVEETHDVSSTVAGLKVKVERTKSVTWRSRHEVRKFLKKHDVAQTLKSNEVVEIMSDKPSSIRYANYDVRYADGSHGKESVWNVHLPSRTPYLVGHFNPAVTYAVSLLGDVHPDMAIMYIVAQMFGACMGAAFVKSIASDADYTLPIVSSPRAGVTDGEAFGAETLLVALGSFFCLATFVSPWAESIQIRHPFFFECAPLFVGIVTTMLSLVGCATLNYSSMNLAISFGSAFVNDHYEDLWIFALASWFGGAIATALWFLLFGTESENASISFEGAKTLLDREVFLHTIRKALRVTLGFLFAGENK